jgi:hypothetical protein
MEPPQLRSPCPGGKYSSRYVYRPDRLLVPCGIGFSRAAVRTGPLRRIRPRSQEAG